MPLINNFRATNIWKAFILNSIAAAIVIVIGVTVKAHYDTYHLDHDDKKSKILRNGVKIEYLEIRNKNNLSKYYNKFNFKIFIAYYINKIRLIDNF